MYMYMLLDPERFILPIIPDDKSQDPWTLEPPRPPDKFNQSNK